MRFVETELAGVTVIEIDRLADDRGFFARSYCAREFAEHGLETLTAQCNVSYNHRRGTLRGMHFQRTPHSEAKLVRCTSGRILDVVVDLRRDSPTHCRWIGVELSAENRAALYIPTGFAHGFQTLEDGCEVLYQMSEFFVPGAADGVPFDDPAFGIAWPLDVTVISDRDRDYERYAP